MRNTQERVWFGFDVVTEKGPILKPTQLRFWKTEEYKKHQPDAPLHYKADALVGLAAVHLNPHLKNPFTSPQMSFPFCNEAWLALEPHRELFERSQERVHALRSHLKDKPASVSGFFESSFTEVLNSCIQPWGIDLEGLTDLIECIDHLETKSSGPLLYNFSLKFSRPTIEKLHFLHSLLFNLRTLLALDYNAYLQDPTHEAVKVDSITDYLAKADYVANDALLYHHFKKQKDRMPDDVAHQMEKAFKQFSHNGYCLIENLPKSFINSLNHAELEETLYIVQMDWLLGTDAGLLFKIREELFGLREGYDRIFWPELEHRQDYKGSTLSVNCELTDNDVFPNSEAA